MDLEYFKKQIHEELCGAKWYIKHAIEIKAMAPEWSPILVEMSATELSHATSLYKMAEQYYKKITSQYATVPKYLEEMWKEIVDEYADKSAKVKMLHSMYK